MRSFVAALFTVLLSGCATCARHGGIDGEIESRDQRPGGFCVAKLHAFGDFGTAHFTQCWYKNQKLGWCDDIRVSPSSQAAVWANEFGTFAFRPTWSEPKRVSSDRRSEITSIVWDESETFVSIRLIDESEPVRVGIP
jgi:hypothetical protein